MAKPRTRKTRKVRRNAKPRSLARLVRSLILEYQEKRAKHYRQWQKAYREGDECTQIVAAALQLAYTEMQVDLEKALEASNGLMSRRENND